MRSFAAIGTARATLPVARVNDHAAEVGEHSARWAADLGLVSTPDAAAPAGPGQRRRTRRPGLPGRPTRTGSACSPT